MNLTVLMWTLITTVLSGSFILAVLVVPEISLMLHLTNALAIISAAALGAIVAIPVAALVTKAMLGTQKTA